MAIRPLLSLGSLLWLSISSIQAQAAVRSTEWQQIRQTAVGSTHLFLEVPVATDRKAELRMKRIDVYAADARILEPQADGSYKELPRSDWLHFVTDHGGDVTAPRLGLSIAPDGSNASGVLMTADGYTYVVQGMRQASEPQWSLRRSNRDNEDNLVGYSCMNDLGGAHSMVAEEHDHAAPLASGQSLLAASRSGVVAVDTDNEFMQLKFSNNTSNATNYLAQLFVGLNVIYERDLDLTLTQGLVLLRTSGTPDPYSQSAIIAQLTEFGNVWVSTQNATNRAFAMLLSGKSDDPLGSSGLAWVLNTNNYCSARNANGGHYSVTQVFRFNGSTATNDLPVIAHELGHNFGAHHSHCSNATTGAGPTSSNTIDTCFSGEQGCFSGTPVCPASSTVNGQANVRGTLMSYCNVFLSGLPSCTDSNVFANAHRTLLLPRVTNNVTSGCFSGGPSVNQAPTLNVIPNPAAILEDAGQQTVNLSGISDGNSGTQVLSVSASSSNTGLIPNPSVTYSSPASTGSIHYTPVANQSGSATITVTVTDNGGTANGGVDSFSRNFTVTVTPVNDAPTLDAIGTPGPLPVSAGQRVIALSGISAGPGETQTLSVTASSSNTGLIPNPAVSYTSPNATGSISYTPVAGQSGSATITVTVTDNGGTANGGVNQAQRSFTQNVVPGLIFGNGFE